MKKEEKKIFYRLGAALMLGLSLFNLGSIWLTKSERKAPKRFNNIKIKQQEQQAEEDLQIAQIAEREAAEVIKEETIFQKESQQQLSEERVNFSVKVLQYSIVGTWLVAAGIFFSSVIFNVPFGLGKGILSLLPGIPHLAEIKVDSPERVFSLGEEIVADVILKGENNAKTLKVKIFFPTDLVKFQGIHLVDDDAVLKNRQINEEAGEIIFILEKQNGFGGGKIAAIYFQAKAQGEGAINPSSKSCLVLVSDKDGGVYNVLGKTTPFLFRID